MIGRYPMRSAWAFHVGRIDTSGVTGTPVRDMHASTTAVLVKERRGDNPSPWVNWWFGDDGITALTTYTRSFGTLKRWTGSAWVPATLKMHLI